MSSAFHVGLIFAALGRALAVSPAAGGACEDYEDDQTCVPVPAQSQVLLQKKHYKSDHSIGPQESRLEMILRSDGNYDLRKSSQQQSHVQKKESVTAAGTTVLTDILDMHNHYRCMHATPNLAWSDTLAASAKVVADLGAWAHSGSPNGENLYWASHPESVETGMRAVKAWYKEVADYSYESTGSINGKAVGHFTQVVWAASTALGCSKGTLNDGGGQFWVCQYSPAGNVRQIGDEQPFYNKNVKQPTVDEADCPSPEPTPAPGGGGGEGCADGGLNDSPTIRMGPKPMSCADLGPNGPYGSFCGHGFVKNKCKHTCGC